MNQRHSFWAGYWKRVILVGLIHDVAKSAFGIRDKLVDHETNLRPSRPRSIVHMGLLLLNIALILKPYPTRLGDTM